MRQLSLPFGPAIDCEAKALVQAAQRPAWLIDVARGCLLAASPGGAAILGLEGDSEGWSLDAAMPGLARLRELAGRLPPDAAPLEEHLLFWTPSGARTVACDVRAVAGGEPGTLVLVTASTDPSATAGECAERPPSRSDAETLELIARRIRDPGFVGAHREPSEVTDADPVGGAKVAVAAAPSHRESEAPDILARLAHELKTPLSAIAAAAEIMRDERLGPLGRERYRDYAGDICDSARHALAVIARMLGQPAPEAQRAALSFAEIDINALAERSVSAMQPLFEQAGLELSTVLQPRLPHVIADAVSLKQIVFNLLTNALKFAARGVEVEVSTRYEVDGPVTISVRDTGPGMSAATLRQARGERGGSDPREPAGLGIGLALVQTLAKANGARVAIESAPRQGTSVEIIFGKNRVVPV